MATVKDFDYTVKHKLAGEYDGGGHERWSFYVGDKKVGWVERSRGLRQSAQINDWLLGMMANEMNCNRSLWKRLLACQSQLPHYLNGLRTSDIITQDERDAAVKRGHMRREGTRGKRKEGQKRPR